MEAARLLDPNTVRGNQWHVKILPLRQTASGLLAQVEATREQPVLHRGLSQSARDV